MAKGARKHQDVYLAPKIGKEALKNLQGLLILVGKPFYLLLSYLVIALLFVFYLVGHLARTIAASVIRPKIKIELLWLKIKLLPIKLTVGIKNPLPEFKLKLRFGLIAPLFLLALSFFTFWYIILRNLPSPDKLITKEEEISTKIYDRNGVLLYKIYKNKNRTPVSLEKIPIQVRLATLAAEDAEFYSHPGFSIKGILRALLKNLKEGEVNGGSTITQQLVKNALLTPEKTLSRKIKEIILAIEVELTYSKDQILEMYLNEVSYGGTAYGIQEAAQYYFGKDVGKLSLKFRTGEPHMGYKRLHSIILGKTSENSL